jgi:hypothetical protein
MMESTPVLIVLAGYKDVAVGTNKLILTSTNGISWTVQSSDITSWNDIAYGNNLYVAVGNSPITILTSPDGYNWTKQYVCNYRGRKNL